MANEALTQVPRYFVPPPKQSFGEMRSRAGVWERESVASTGGVSLPYNSWVKAPLFLSVSSYHFFAHLVLTGLLVHRDPGDV